VGEGPLGPSERAGLENEIDKPKSGANRLHRKNKAMNSSITTQIKRSLSRRLTPMLLATAILSCGAPLARAGGGNEGNPGVLPPQSHPYGKSYGEWSAAHWQWTYSLPVDHHPLTDTADVSAGQSGPVWFLGGTWAPTTDLNGNLVGNADRQVTIPAGKALFFPIIDAEQSLAEGGTSEADCRAVANGFADHATGLSCTIDGRAVEHLSAYRTESPFFPFGPLPANNLLGLPEGTTSSAVSDGYFVMVAPLSPGQHTIHFTSAFVFTTAADGFDFSFSLDITYHITVASAGQAAN
jgi:hypothetical protein